jgi:hypothetical protein
MAEAVGAPPMFSSTTKGITSFDLPADVISSRYEVKVDGQHVPVFRAALNTNFLSFECTGPVTVSVTLPESDYWSSGAFVRPLARGISPKVNDNIISFQVNAPAKLSVERAGVRGPSDEVLFLFANSPESAPPPASSANVIVLPPGLHRQNIDLKSGQTLYLEGGAVLMGSVNIWNVEDVKVLGRGTILYDGPQDITQDEGPLLRNWRPISINNARNVTVNGITCVTRSRTWSIQNVRSENLRFENINIISANTANVNGDGFDFLGCDHVVIDQCFIRTCDDALAFYGDFMGVKVGLPPRNEVTDVKISRCVFWATLANILRVGFIDSSPTTHDFSVRDCDVIHQLKGGATFERDAGGQFHYSFDDYATCKGDMSDHVGSDTLRTPYALFEVWVPAGKNQIIHENYLFEDIRLEDYNALIGVDAPGCLFRNIRFHNINAALPLTSSLFRGKVDSTNGFSFDNVSIGGVLVHKIEDIPLKFVDPDPIGMSFKVT